MRDKLQQQFKKGSFEMILLSLIAEGRTYGYEIISALVKRGSPFFKNAKEGSVYPILYRMEDDGLIKSTLSQDGRKRIKKYYEITPKGTLVLQELKAFWSEYKLCVDRMMEG